MEQIVQKGEFISRISEELEREYRGRVFLFPPFTYISGQRIAEEKRLQEWERILLAQGMRHIIYITSDHEWKEFHSLGGSVCWLPALPIHVLDEKAAREILQSQIREVMMILMEKWEKTE